MASGLALMTTRQYLPVSDLNLILTGYTGPRQPAIGRRGAAMLHRTFVNIDMQIEERHEMSIEEIRTRFGETRLKTLETEVAQEVLLYRSAVIRVSGQTLLHSGHYERFSATGPVVCLVASLDSVLQNLHLTLGARYHNPNERALVLGELQREWAVRSCPGILEIDTTYKSETEIADAVIALWQQLVL
jgi:shikimate kinase